MPEWLLGIVQAGLTVIALIVIIMLLAGLFMIIFGIATGHRRAHSGLESRTSCVNDFPASAVLIALVWFSPRLAVCSFSRHGFRVWIALGRLPW
jgi:hypothetical protein